MSKRTYTSLHNHSDYSNLRMIDAMMSVPDLIDRAYELNLKGVALTDHEALSGHVKAIQHFNKHYADQDDFKLILGNEIYVTRDGMDSENYDKDVDKFFHQLLIAKDAIGHRQLRELSSRAWNRSFRKGVVRVPTYWSDLREIVGQSPGHLVATSTCLAGVAAQKYIMNDKEGIDEYITNMKDIFGEENFFIELQPSYKDDQINYNNFMIENYWGKEKFIFTTDSHYLMKEHRKLHTAFLNSRRNGGDADKYYSSAHLMDYEEVKEYFKHYIDLNKVEAMKDNTNLIWDMIEIYDLHRPQIVPRIDYEQDRFDLEKVAEVEQLLWENMNKEDHPYLHYFMTTDNETDAYFVRLVYEGYHEKLLNSPVPIKDRIERLNIEFEQIRETSIQIDQSLSDYFITMAKMIEIVWNEADSLVGVGRGSAVGFLTNYLLGITQLDPMTEEVEIPYWRFIHKTRPELPDIDVDTEATKRIKIFNRIKEYFNNIGADVVNVSTFGTEGSKSSIRTAGRALDVDDSMIGYLTSMIPNERGFDWSLSDCYNGNGEDRNHIANFKKEMDDHPDLRDLTFAIEGLITRIGGHAAGIIILEGEPWDHNSLMKTSSGLTVSAYNLEDTEYLGGLKYDMLTVQALDKIHAAMNYLLEDEVISWEGSLRGTYNKYFLPAVLETKDPKLWKLLWDGEVTDAFQFDTMVGSQAVRVIKPQSVIELAAANSIMRLMAQEGMDLPMDTYVEYKNDLNKWYHEMDTYGITLEERKMLEPVLLPLYGVADSQEAAMQLSMNPNIANFSLTEANALRRAIAKKDPVVLQETKQLYYEKGQEAEASKQLLDYIWNVQIRRQEGYSFSLLHTMAYSYIAIQQMNIVYRYPSIYWKTACLSVNAGAINEEDYYNLVDQGIIELSDEDDVRTQTKMQYGKVATAISNMKGEIAVDLPDINLSRLGFTPDANENRILYGIKGIARVGEGVIQDIILDRPYTSVLDFERKLNSGIRKKVSKDRVMNLIKAGAFDRVENRPREEILRDYVEFISDEKQNITLQNFRMLMRKDLVPQSLSEEMKNYNFTLYIRKNRTDDRKYYILDEIAQSYFLEIFPKDKMIDMDGKKVIPIDWWDRLYNLYMDNVRDWIKDNKEEIRKELNKELFQEELKKYASGNILDWELQALNFFHSGHPLENVDLPVHIDKIEDIEEDKILGFWRFDGKKIPQMHLYAIAGTVIERNRQTSTFTLSTIDGVIEVKLYKQQFAKYIHESDLYPDHPDYIPNDYNFLEKGKHLLVVGIKRGDMFLPKVYKKTPFAEISEIVLRDGKFDKFIVKGEAD